MDDAAVDVPVAVMGETMAMGKGFCSSACEAHRPARPPRTPTPSSPFHSNNGKEVMVNRWQRGDGEWFWRRERWGGSTSSARQACRPAHNPQAMVKEVMVAMWIHHGDNRCSSDRVMMR